MRSLIFFILFSIYSLNAQTIIKRVDQYVLLDTCTVNFIPGKILQVINEKYQKIGEIEVIKCKNNMTAAVVKSELLQDKIKVGDYVVIEINDIKPQNNIPEFGRLYRIGTMGFAVLGYVSYMNNVRLNTYGIEVSILGRVDIGYQRTNAALDKHSASSTYVSLLLKHTPNYGSYFNIIYSGSHSTNLLGLGISVYFKIPINSRIKFIPEISISDSFNFQGTTELSGSVALYSVLGITRYAALITGFGVGFVKSDAIYALQCGLAISEF